MDVELITSGQVMAYDLQTKFATSAVAPGMKAVCQFAISNENRIDEQSLIEQGFALNQAGARNLLSSGIESGVWDGDGVLTDDGHETAQTGEVLTDEVGPIRIWTFNHETTGAVLLHAERAGLLPIADAEPSNANPPDTLLRLSTGVSTRSMKSGDNRRWRLQYAEDQSAWAIQEKFCAPAKLSWSWKYDDGWLLDDEIVFGGKISGCSKKPAEDGISVNKNYPQTGALNPESCIREWLTKGRFTSGPWDGKLGGLKRPFSELSNAEKSMQTTDEVLDGNELEDWDRVTLREIQLFTKTLDDATDWAIHLINEETPGYTTTEDTNRKLGDILERPFMCLDSDKVQGRVEKSLASSRADPRLSKLLHAGDDLDAVALVPDWIITQKREERSAEYDGSGDYAEFVKQITLNMKGDVKQIIYVDRYTHNSNYRKRLNSFSDAINELIPGALFDIVTAHTPYTQHHHGQQEQKSAEFKRKLLKFCNQVYFMEDTGDKIPHDRVIIVRSNSETRCWCLTFGITAKNRSVPAMRIDETKLEPSLLNHLKVTKAKREASS